MLSHRLGLVPLRIDPALLEFKSAEEAPSEKNTLVFKLDVTCKRSGDKVINDRGEPGRGREGRRSGRAGGEGKGSHK